MLLELGLSKPRKKYKDSSLWQSRQLSEADLPACRTHFEQHIEVYKKLLTLGKTGYASFCTKTGDVIAILWFSNTDYDDVHHYQYNFKVKPHQTFQFAAEVCKPFRNKHVSVDLCHTAWNEWQEKGMTTNYCTVEATNIPSLRIQFHLGFEEMGEVLYMHQLFNMRWFQSEKYSKNRYDDFNKHKQRQKRDR